MQSGKSCFNLALFKKNLTRFWPIWGTYLVGWLLMPLMILNNGWSPETPLRTIGAALITAAVWGVLAAMAVFSYLYNSKSVQLLHSLPLKREGLFLTNYLSGLSFLLVPNLIVFTLSLLAGGYLHPRTLILWLVAQCLLGLFFYSFAVFCAMFTGSLLALPIFYGILNFLAMGVVYTVTGLLQEFLFGFSGTTGLDQFALWLTPVAKLLENPSYDFINGVYILNGLGTMLLYSAVGLLLAVAALFIYRARRLETAGDLVSVRWVRPVFKYGVAFCAAVSLGTWFYYSFHDLFPKGDWAILLSLIFWGVAGFFAADMLLKKNFKVFGKAWKGALCFALVLVAAFVFTSMDFFGYNRAPALSSIASVRVTGTNSVPNDTAYYGDLTFTDREDIDAVLALHSTIAANKDALRKGLLDEQNDPQPIPLQNGAYTTASTYEQQYLYFYYTLTDGRVIRRQYNLPLYAENLENENSVESLLTALINRPSSLEQLYWGSLLNYPEAKLVDVSLDVYDEESGSYTSAAIYSAPNQQRLLAALKTDMAAGRLGVRYLFDTAERYENCYYNDLYLSFYLPAGTSKENSDKLISTDGSTLPAAMNESRDWSIAVTLQKNATETLKVLEELGYTDNGQLVSWAEEIRRGDGERTAQEAEYPDTTIRAVG